MPCAGAKAAAAAVTTKKVKKIKEDKSSRASHEHKAGGSAGSPRSGSPGGAGSPPTVGASGYKVQSRVVDTKFKRKRVEPPKDYDELMLQVTAGKVPIRNEMLEGVAADPQAFHDEANRLRARLKKANKGLIDPNAKHMQYWDLTMLVLLFYTATVTPFEVCMMWQPTQRDGLWVLNWVVNLLFITDMVFNFITPYIDSKTHTRVRSHWRIAKHYFRTWFFLDFISVVPIDTIMMGIDLSAGGEILKMIRMLRLMRLVKLAKILRASNIFARWENFIPFTYQTRELMKWMAIVVMLLHWLACALGMAAQLQGTLRTSELEAGLAARLNSKGDDGEGGQCYGCIRPYNAAGFGGVVAQLDPSAMGSYCATLSECLTPCELDVLARIHAGPNAYEQEVVAKKMYLSKQETWVCRYHKLGTVSTADSPGQMWVAALYVALIQLGGGVGSIVPENLTEYILFLVAILVGSVTWAMVVGTICGMMATADPHKIAFRQQMDSLNYFMKEIGMPDEIRMQCRSYVHSKKDLHKQESYAELIEWLSPGLRAPVLLHMTGRALRNVWYLNELSALDSDCLVMLAQRLVREAYPARERIPAGDTLKIITKGIAAKGGIILYGHYFDMWGDDMILHTQVLRDKRAATALTYVELDTLSRNDLYDVLLDFPVAAAQVRDAAVRVALKRTVKLIKAYTDRRAIEVADQSEGGARNKAALMLNAAFSNPLDDGEAGFSDPAKIFRIITGGVFKDVDENGNLVETVIMEQDDFPLSPEHSTRVALPAGAVARHSPTTVDAPPGSPLPPKPAEGEAGATREPAALSTPGANGPPNGLHLPPMPQMAPLVRPPAEGGSAPPPRALAWGASASPGVGGGGAESQGELAATLRREMVEMRSGLSGEIAKLQSGLDEIKAMLVSGRGGGGG